MREYQQKLLPSNSYHLFSRAVGDEKIFREEKNYNYFLKKLGDHSKEVADVYTYSLLPNHFHLVVHIKDFEAIVRHFEIVKKKKFEISGGDISDFIMERFSNFLNSYTKSINKMYKRKGSLFIDYLKRSRVKKNDDLTAFIFYTHKNAVHHGYIAKIGDWKYDAYQSLLSDKPTNLLRNEVLEWFGGRNNFIRFHDQPVDIKRPEWF